MGRNPGDDARQYQIQSLWNVHHEILRRLVLGQKSVDIARDLNVTPPVVSYVKNSEIGKRQLSLMNAASDVSVVNVAGRIKELAVQAVAVMEAALEDTQPMPTRIKAAVDVLDRAGYPKVVRTENLHAHLTDDDINAIKSRAREQGVIVEAEVISGGE